MLSENLQYYRKRLQMSQVEFARRLGVGRSAVCMWEKGYRKPNVETLIRIARLLCVTLDELLK